MTKAALIPKKWRPSLGMITGIVIIAMVALPLIGLMFFRLYENQLIRQTETELIGQSAVIAAIMSQTIAAAEAERRIDDQVGQIRTTNTRAILPRGPSRPPPDYPTKTGRFSPIEPTLDLTRTPILPDRPTAQPPSQALTLTPTHQHIAQTLTPILEQTQTTTLAGFRITDANGLVFAGGNDVGRSFAHIEELQAALNGHFASVLRQRPRETPAPPLYSISRGAKVRVFTATPVFVDNTLVGVVYASRTPENILKHLYRERDKVALATLVVLAAGAATWWIFVRTITKPIKDLTGRADRIRGGDSAAVGALAQHGTKEVAHLTERFMHMAKTLSHQSQTVRTFTAHVSHELKAPLTAIRGAAELLADGTTPQQRDRFLANILNDVSRASLLLERLRDLARADAVQLGGQATLDAITPHITSHFAALEISWQGATPAPLAISTEHLTIILSHLLDNATRHNATKVTVAATHDTPNSAVNIRVANNGTPILDGNKTRIFEAFFTTRRADGGTGMGLAIVQSLLRAHGGEITLSETPQKQHDMACCFTITLPLADAAKT